MILAPFFPYYGSCHSMAKLYPRPRYPRLIESFAGSACYSLHHHTRDVVLIERDPVIAELWRYLIRVSPEEVLALPDLEPGQSTDDLDVCPAARSLISTWLGRGASNVGNKMGTAWCHNPQRNEWYWPSKGQQIRHRIARQLPAIRHWTVLEGDATNLATDGSFAITALQRLGRGRGGWATWFVDPPYQGRPGSHYRYGSKLISYEELGAWCKLLRGQVMVREQLGADWLPFERIGTVNGQRGKSTEVAWFSCQEDRPGWRQPGLF